MTDSKTTALIVTWNGRELVGNCLRDLLAGRPHLPVMIVDNSSTDGTAEYVRREFPQVEVLESGANLGYGQGCNYGLRRLMARPGEYFLLVNQDARLRPEALDRLEAAADAHPEMGILIPTNLTFEGDRIDPGFEAALGDPRLGPYRADRAAGRLREVYTAGILPGAVKLVRKSTVEGVGGYDPLFFLYGVEYDYHLRAERHGWRSGLVPKAVVLHSYIDHRMEGRVLTFAQRLDRMRWLSLFRLKRMDHPLARNVAVTFLRLVEETARALVAGDAAGVRIGLLAGARSLVLLPRVVRHRRRSRRGQGAFF
ncbi:MAG: glycosyltransferase family 2 protein [Acidobacteria bacterium]|nr:glycosyltransferase family 2 protein [Acidobacteriota bacterium]